MAQGYIFLLHTLWTGVLIALVYDGLLVLRKTIPHNAFWLALEDIGFWFFCAIYVFLWLHRESSGTLRWYAVVGALVGMWLYKKTLCGLLLKTGVFVLERLLRILENLLVVLATPLRLLKRKSKALHTKIRKQRRKILGKCKIKLNSFAKALKIRLCKQ